MEIENEQVLSYHDLWEIMIGETPKPYTMSNYYTKKSKIALLILTFSLEDDSVHHFHNIKTTFDVWMKLKSLNEISNQLFNLGEEQLPMFNDYNKKNKIAFFLFTFFWKMKFLWKLSLSLDQLNSQN